MRKFSLTLDDFSCHPNSGLRFESIKWCDKLVEKYPQIKIDLFTTIALWRLDDKVPSYITNNPEWISFVKSLSPKNYRIDLHGYFHRRTDGGYSNNDEFECLGYYTAKSIIDSCIKVFEKVGIEYHKCFRPPGWKISADAAQVLSEMGFVIAGNDKYYQILRNQVKDLKWISYNWDMTGPCNVSGDIIVFGHTSNWTNNYMNEDRFNLVDAVLSKEEFDFVFIEDLAK